MLSNLSRTDQSLELMVGCPRGSDFFESISTIAKPVEFSIRHNSQALGGSQILEQIAYLESQYRPHVIHANSLNVSRFLGQYAKESKPICVGHIRDMFKLSRKAIDDINQLERVVVVSEAARQFHIENGLCPNRSRVIHNGVDLKEFTPVATAERAKHSIDIRSALSIPQDSKLILNIGQIGMRKAQDVLIKAFANCAATNANIHLLIVGQRYSQKDEAFEYEQNLFDLANRDACLGRVHFLGLRRDVRLLMQQSDMLVHTARQEPLGRVLLESLACGLPAIATDVGGTNEIIDDQISGILVEKDNIDQICAAINLLLSDRTKYESIAISARKQAASKFNGEENANAILDLYKELTS